MKLVLALTIAVAAPGFASSASAACLTDAEIETALGAQVRSKAMFLNTGDLTGKPLCSGLTLAQQIQRMREAAFPDERAAREDLEARQRALQAAAPEPPPAIRGTEAGNLASSDGAGSTSSMGKIGKAPPISAVAYFDSLIAEDAAGWVMNRYDRGSMRNMRVVDTANGGRTKTVYGEYSYNGGRNGWVKARFVGTRLECLEFWDFAGQCRPLGHSPSHELSLGLAGALAQGIMSDAGSSSSGSGRRDNCRMELKFVDNNGRNVYGPSC